MNISTQNLIDFDGSVQLKPGQRMVRVSGSTWMPVGVGGNFMPGASQSVSTSDATATASDIKLGKTAYVADGKVTGTLAKAEIAYNSAMYQYYAVADGYVDAGDMVLDFSQATYGDAGADSLLQGATAWVNGRQITGTIPVVSASVSGNTVTVPYGYHQSDNTFTVDTYTGSYNVTPGTTQQQLATADKYMTGNVTVAGDANLVAANIKSGVTIFGVSGTLQESSGTSDSTTGTCQAQYYKCASVSSGASQPEGYNLTVQFYAPFFDEANSGYDWESEKTVISMTIQDASAVGLDRVWISDDGAWNLMKYEIPGSLISWGLYRTATANFEYYVAAENVTNQDAMYEAWGNGETYVDDVDPWLLTGMRWGEDPVDLKDLTWIVSPAALGGNTWSGYKAVFDSGTGTWSFEDTVTEGMSYTGLTPVVNKIYTADTTIQINYIKLAGILNDETVKFLLYPKSSGTLEDISAGGNGVTVTNTGSVAIENNRIVFGDGKALTIPANTLPDDIFVSGKPFLIEFQGIIPSYTSRTCTVFARKEGSMYYNRLDMYLNTIQGDANYGQMTIGYWTNDVTVPVGAFTVGEDHVVAFEYDGADTNRVYLDGVMQYSFTGTAYLPFRIYDFIIGHDSDPIGGSEGNPFQGNMSYFRIRNVAPYQGASYTPEFV